MTLVYWHWVACWWWAARVADGTLPAIGAAACGLAGGGAQNVSDASLPPVVLCALPLDADSFGARYAISYYWAVSTSFGAAAPEGTLTSDALNAWAKDAFGYGAALAATHGEAGLSMQLLVSAAGGDEATEVDVPKAVGLYEACAMLSTYSEEANAPPPEEEP